MTDETQPLTETPRPQRQIVITPDERGLMTINVTGAWLTGELLDAADMLRQSARNVKINAG